MKATPLELAIDVVVDLLRQEEKTKAAIDLSKVCRLCSEPCALLMQDPDKPSEPRRTICGECQGNANRRIVDALPRGKAETPASKARGGRW